MRKTQQTLCYSIVLYYGLYMHIMEAISATE